MKKIRILFICHRMKYVRFNLLAAVLLAAVTMLLSSPDRSVCGVPGSIQLITKDMASQAECDPDEFRLFQLPADSSRRQTVPELSGSPCLICYDRDSGAVDWPAEI